MKKRVVSMMLVGVMALVGGATSQVAFAEEDPVTAVRGTPDQKGK